MAFIIQIRQNPTWHLNRHPKVFRVYHDKSSGGRSLLCAGELSPPADGQPSVGISKQTQSHIPSKVQEGLLLESRRTWTLDPESKPGNARTYEIDIDELMAEAEAEAEAAEPEPARSEPIPIPPALASEAPPAPEPADDRSPPPWDPDKV